MELNEILAISGAPGLYKYVAQGKGGIIVESLSDSRRTMVSGSSKVSALGDIAIFTDNEETPLGEILQTIFNQNDGKEVSINAKASATELQAFMEAALPSFDRERVHNSDIKKIAQWYNILIGAGMTTFHSEEATPEEEAPAKEATPTTDAEVAAAPKKSTKSKSTAAAAVTAAAKKSTTAVKQPTVKAAGSKAASSRSTTARKAQ